MQTESLTDRRAFIAGGTAAALSPAFGAATTRRMRLAFQVYGVRDLCARDLVATLKAARALGFEGVETGRLYGRSGAEWKALCADTGLEFVALQPYPFTLVGENLKRTIRFCHEAGCRRLCTAWFKGSAENPADWQLLVEVINHAADVCAREGLAVAYHNHDQEFRIRFEGRPVWDWLFNGAGRNPELNQISPVTRLSERVGQEFDANWCSLAGEDAVAWFAKSASRNRTIHVTLDDPRCDWPRILALARDNGTEWLVAKPTRDPASLAPLAETYRYLAQHA